MPDLERRFQLKANDFVKAGEVSLQVQALLKSVGFEASIVRRVSICAYEAEMNVVMHGGDGKAVLMINPDEISLEFRDEGPGIEDIEMAFKPGYSTASEEHREMGFGAGMGLPNIRENADELEVKSEKGEGTNLKVRFMVRHG
jgi:anti-sigma regulatory factor (Ser/Thr protein kinase)